MIGLIKGLPRKVNMAGSPQPIVTFTSNVSGLYIPEILAYITATQEGTGDPSPSNPRAISGVSEAQVWGTGKNLINIADQSINTTYYWGYIVQTDIRVKSGYTYTFSCDIAGAPTPFRVSFGVGTNPTTYAQDVKHIDNYTNGHISGSYTVSSDHDGKYLFLRLPRYQVQTAIECTISNIQLELGNTATPYEAYTGQTATINLGGTYYGGYLNVTTGLLTVTDIIEDMGNLTWYRTTSYTNPMFYASPTGKEPIDTGFMCEKYKYLGSFSNASSFSSSENYTCGDSTVNTQIYVRDDNYLDAASFKTAMTGTKIKYRLATPQTYQLTPAQITQLLGQNNVFCSSGDVEVTQIWARRDRSIISRG